VPNKILSVEGEIVDINKIISAVEDAGFDIEELKTS
jgi:copper chaperone CopZ